MLEFAAVLIFILCTVTPQTAMLVTTVMILRFLVVLDAQHTSWYVLAIFDEPSEVVWRLSALQRRHAHQTLRATGFAAASLLCYAIVGFVHQPRCRQGMPLIYLLCGGSFIDLARAVYLLPGAVAFSSLSLIGVVKETRWCSRQRYDESLEVSVCTICREFFEKGDDMLRLRCRDVVHETCATIWFRRNVDCPVCQKVFMPLENLEDVSLLLERIMAHGVVVGACFQTTCEIHMSTAIERRGQDVEEQSICRQLSTGSSGSRQLSPGSSMCIQPSSGTSVTRLPSPVEGEGHVDEQEETIAARMFGRGFDGVIAGYKAEEDPD
eukprot:CAMPEP_0170577426 /NCGR_PEP_ID=MMETSP0224-20130122/4921_1 /TAXON_ID=285029 /ORGANISM="Togula jolla, Strain CCCM 725" /LENGTH=322 /DNA_ID=CAMNT_0010900337 /DNA_START=57 /DNA_END=1025 /DNA_ORIENTATION=+